MDRAGHQGCYVEGLFQDTGEEVAYLPHGSRQTLLPVLLVIVLVILSNDLDSPCGTLLTLGCSQTPKWSHYCDHSHKQ